MTSLERNLERNLSIFNGISLLLRFLTKFKIELIGLLVLHSSVNMIPKDYFKLKDLYFIIILCYMISKDDLCTLESQIACTKKMQEEKSASK